MESAGSAIVDFGRFCTGFLVVMGVGMCHASTSSQKHKGKQSMKAAV